MTTGTELESKLKDIQKRLSSLPWNIEGNEKNVTRIKKIIELLDNEKSDWERMMESIIANAITEEEIEECQ